MKQSPSLHNPKMYFSTPIDDLVTGETSSLAPPQPPRMTTVANAKPHDGNATAGFPIPWSSGLCDCFHDFDSCCLTCWCPCIAFGRIAEMVDGGSIACGVSGTLYQLMMSLTGCPCVYSCFYRSKLRRQYNLEERPFGDFCVHCCCEECALCQEYRELQNHGFELSIGWYGNMERRRRRALIPTLGLQNTN